MFRAEKTAQHCISSAVGGRASLAASCTGDAGMHGTLRHTHTHMHEKERMTRKRPHHVSAHEEC